MTQLPLKAGTRKKSFKNNLTDKLLVRDPENSFNKKWFTVIGNIKHEHFLILPGLLLSSALFIAQALSVFTSDHLIDSMSAEAIEVFSI